MDWQFVERVAYLPIRDFMKLFPPTRMADTMIVIIPMGAIPSRIVSTIPMLVPRNCFVTPSPKRVSSGAKSKKALLKKLSESGVVALLVAILVTYLDFGYLRDDLNFLDDQTKPGLCDGTVKRRKDRQENGCPTTRDKIR